MSNVDWMDVEKSENRFILIDFCARDFSRDDFAKETSIFHKDSIHQNSNLQKNTNKVPTQKDRPVFLCRDLISIIKRQCLSGLRGRMVK